MLQLWVTRLQCVFQLKMTPLHWAVEKGHMNAIQLLIKQGADINCENKVSFQGQGDFAMTVVQVKVSHL